MAEVYPKSKVPNGVYSSGYTIVYIHPIIDEHRVNPTWVYIYYPEDT